MTNDYLFDSKTEGEVIKNTYETAKALFEASNASASGSSK
jgi:hypothetical protein